VVELLGGWGSLAHLKDLMAPTKHLHGPFKNPHVICAVSNIIFFICCQWSFTSRYFHSASATLCLTMLWYSSHIFSSLSFHIDTLGTYFLCHVFVVLNRMSITNSLCFGTHSSLRMTLTLRIFALSSCYTWLDKELQFSESIIMENLQTLKTK